MSGIEYADKGTDRADPESGVYYICEKCDRPISENQKPKMLRAGEWRATVEPKDKRHAGFHLNRLYSPWVSWVDIALDLEASQKDPQQHQVFVNATLGLPYEMVAGEQLEGKSWKLVADQPIIRRDLCQIDRYCLQQGLMCRAIAWNVRFGVGVAVSRLG